MAEESRAHPHPYTQAYRDTLCVCAYPADHPIHTDAATAQPAPVPERPQGTSPFVPKHGPRPTDGQTCGYSPTKAEPRYCGQPATWHVMWDGERDNSFTCDKHMDLVLSRWVFDDRHPVHADCGMPGALWLFKGKRCEVPGSSPAFTHAARPTTEETK